MNQCRRTRRHDGFGALHVQLAWFYPIFGVSILGRQTADPSGTVNMLRESGLSSQSMLQLEQLAYGLGPQLPESTSRPP